MNNREKIKKIRGVIDEIMEFLEYHVDDATKHFVPGFQDSLELLEEYIDIINKKKLMQIEGVLKKMEFSFGLKGTRYLCDAILFALEGQASLADIYARVAIRHNNNEKAVEKDIRVAIENAWSAVDIKKLRKLYPFEWNDRTGRPANAEFIKNVALLIEEQG